MTDEQKMTESTAVEPVHATVIGVGSSSERFLPSGTVAQTPGNAQPDVVMNVVSPIVAIVVRFINTFLTTLVGLVMAGMTPAGQHVIKANDFLQLVAACATLSVAGAGVGLLKDLVTIFGRLETKYPLGTGSV
jgi:hypothetical protein